MALLTAGIPPKPYGGGGRMVDLPVKASTQLYQGQMLAWLGAGLVPGSTAGAGDAVGIATHDALGGATDGVVRVLVWTDHTFTLNNGANALSDATPIGTLCFMEDDHTIGTGGVGGSGEGVAGPFMGMNDDGTVRAYFFPNFAGTLQNVPVNGTNLTTATAQNASSLGRNTRYLLAGPLTAATTITLITTGAKIGDQITIARTDTTAFTVAVVNGGVGGGTIATLDVSKAGFVRAYFNGTNWLFDSAGIA